MSKDFNIDDILREADKLRSKQQTGEIPRPDVGLSQLDKAIQQADEIKKEDVSEPSFSFSQEEDQPLPEPKKEKGEGFREYKKKKAAVEEESFFQQVDLPSEQQGFRRAEDAQPVETPVRPLRRTTPSRNEPMVERSGGKVDLFDFQPEKREKPIKVGPYGQKWFDFNKTPEVPKVGGMPMAPPKAEAPKIQKIEEFDFESISDKIDKISREKDQGESVRDTNPFRDQERTGHSARITAGIDKIVFKQEGTNGLEDTPDPASSDSVLIEQPRKRRSLFSTFATGTGQELKVEDIKRIDFGAVDGAGLGYYDDEDDAYYGDEIPEGRALAVTEYRQDSSRKDVAKDIAKNKLGVFIRTALLAVLTIVLFYLGISATNLNLSLPPAIFPTGSTLKNYLMTCTILTASILIICWDTTISGIAGLLRMRANSNTLVTFAVLGTVFQGIHAIRNVDTIDPLTMNLLFPVATFAMLFNYIGKLSMLGRIQQNFRITAANCERKGVAAVDSPAYCRELMPDITVSQPTIAYGIKADFYSDFLGQSLSTKYDVGINRAVAPVCIVGAIIVGLATRFLTASTYLAASAFAAVLCVCATLSSTFIENIPLGKMAKKLTPQGAMVSGNKAVEAFCDTKGVILTEKDLFPKGHVYLNGIKAFPKGRIDEAILDAASVLCTLEGSLGDLFLDMIGGDRRLLKKVDNVTYENNMGLSGWVDGRRVLIGNRLLMQNHGVALPKDSYEKANPNHPPGNPIYLSNTGEVSARFLIEYVIDDELLHYLDLMAQKEKQLIVYTTDPNVNENMIWNLYNYPKELITVMASELQEEYREISASRESMPAEIVYANKASSFIAAILATINAKTSIVIATIIQLFQIALGYGMVALMAFMGYLSALT